MRNKTLAFDVLFGSLASLLVAPIQA